MKVTSMGAPQDNTITGERISKEYRDRYANFSKGAHFSFGKQGMTQLIWWLILIVIILFQFVL